MRSLKRSSRKCTEETNSLRARAIDFIAAGVGCNCLAALEESGILGRLLSNKYLSQKDIENLESPLCIQSALVTLEKCKIVESIKGSFTLTQFGRAIAEFSGLIKMLFDGYSDLMAQQSHIIKKKIKNTENLIRGASVSKAAVQLASNTFDPILVSEFSQLKFSGTICDLGCGYGQMLAKVCKASSNPGLGFDSEPEVVKQARKLFKDTNISIELGNITNLQGIWEDVVVLMQCHVFHDFTPNEKCARIMNSFLNNFPNMRYFFYLDTVSPSQDRKEILPGFDYVHGLLGIPTRNYEETMKMFASSNYTVVKEQPIENLPNTFLWVLSPKPRNK